METRTLFQRVSSKMRADFEASGQIKHAASKGTVRENQLRNFLAEGRLPPKYGLGVGEIVGRVRDTSRQCDVIVYDKLNGVKLFSYENVQVYPIDCIYGIIEVKSALSKQEFIDALEKIKAFKAMSSPGTVSEAFGGGFTLQRSRPRPFGLIFAFGLGNNSLESLGENLREWESNTPATLWPNYVCILEVGIIEHLGKVFETCHDSDKISSDAHGIIPLSFGADSLFKFYCALHDMCAHMHLGSVELSPYYDPPIRIGKYVVHGRGMEATLVRKGQEEKAVRLTEAALDRIVMWCALHGKMRYGEVLKRQFGTLPLSLEKSPIIDREVFFYNPNNLPGLHELGDRRATSGENGLIFNPTPAIAITLQIDDESYVIAELTDVDYECM